MDDDAAIQSEEIETLQSIYLPHELVVSQREGGTSEVLALVSVPVPENYHVKFELENGTPCTLLVEHLPPISLKITYNPSYPSKLAPGLNISCVWLTAPERRKLHNFLQQTWIQNLGSPIIYTWIEAVRAEVLTLVGKDTEINLTTAESDEKDADRSLHEPSCSKENVKHYQRSTRKPLNIVSYLEAYNNHQIQEVFLKSYVACEICFTEKLGKDSVQFSPCRHTFCRECLKGYFSMLVTQGSSSAVKCPAYKCETEASQTQVREVLPAELFDKYDSALLNTMLDTMSDIARCPRQDCQYPVTWKPEDKMAVCPSCRYPFCIYCKMVYHGVNPCRVNADERRKLVEAYQSASIEERHEMEARYGKKQIGNLVSNTLSEYWIKDNSKRCPKCNIVIEKSDGCNKMTCFRCHAYFCWLCGKPLDPKTPYLHFQNPSSPCNNRLFEFGDDGPDDEWDEVDEWIGDEDDDFAHDGNGFRVFNREEFENEVRNNFVI